MDITPNDSSLALVARLNAAMNRHDLAAFVACFDPDYESEQPAHPDRRFRGVAQVERNWAAMFAGLPDFRATLVHSAVADGNVWVEWRWYGTRADGSRLEMCGVCIFAVRDDRITSGRLYMEDVDVGRGIEAAVASLALGEETGEKGTGQRRRKQTDLDR
jgi:ketosteroid isomerase-like protein